MRSSGYKKLIKLRVMMVMAVAAAVVVGLVKMLIMFGQSCGCLFGMGGSHEMCHKTEPDDNLL